MRRNLFLAACIVAAGVAAGGVVGVGRPRAQPAPLDPTRRALPVEGVITNPDWARKPTGNDIANYYPHLATVIGIEGQAIIRCSVTAEGGLAGCTVTAESPKGMRFGEATLRLANLFRMKPMTVDGNPVSGGMINIPVRFALPHATPPQPEVTLDAVTPSPKAMALARRVATVTARNYVTGWKANMDQLRTSEAPLTPEETAALDGFDQSLANQAPQIVDQYAAIYGRIYSEAELAGIAGFLESPAGLAWISRGKSLTPAYQAVAFKVQQTASADARTLLCQQTTCPAPRTVVRPAETAARPQLPVAK
ncbi:TonB family protein [Phenylobacterium sp.]|jgi:TonB family protein|uniref:TonB family protein n=1 Tax=Phenylobacterium sp. TaxID=1871053 RepID=UPI002F412193